MRETSSWMKANSKGHKAVVVLAPVFAIAVGCGGRGGQSDGYYVEGAAVGGKGGRRSGNDWTRTAFGASAGSSTQVGGASVGFSGSPHASVAGDSAAGCSAGGSFGGGTSGITPPLDCSMLIDDMEEGSGRIGTRCNRNGVWYAFNANTEAYTVSGSQEPAPTQPGVPILPTEIPGGRESSKLAMHTTGVSSRNPQLRAWWGGIGFDLAFDGQQYRSYAVSGYDGVTFWAKGSSSNNYNGVFYVELRVSTVATTLDKYGGTCTDEPCNPHAKGVELSSEWQQRWIPFSELLQASTIGNPQPFDPRAVTNIQFYCSIGCTSFDFWIDDISFYKVAEGT